MLGWGGRLDQAAPCRSSIFARPLFNDAERSFNVRLADAMEALGYTVFLPQRDGAERTASHTCR